MTSVNNSLSSGDTVTSILRAIYVGNLEKVNEILDSCGPSYLMPWEEKQRLISEAITTRRLDIAKVLITRGCQIGDTVSDWMPLYRNAMLSGDIELVALLLDKDPNSPIKCQHGLLHLAVSENLLPMVELLLNHGANANLSDNDGLFPANIAAKRGNCNILKLLLSAGACIEGNSYSTRKTNLFYAIESGDKDIVKLLLKNGANCNVKLHNGKTALHCAIERGQTDITRMLVTAGADLDQRNSIGQTPLHVACMLNNMIITFILLNAGADVNATDDNGMVPCDACEKKIVSSCVFMNSPVSFLLIKQLIILKEGELYMNHKNEVFFDMFMKTYYGKDVHADFRQSEMVKDIISTCQEEICLMKEIKSNNLTCYSVLKKLKNPLNVPTEGEINLLQSVIIGNKCPVYESVLKPQLKYATLRISLLRQAQEYFSVATKLSKNKLPSIPEEMQRYVVSYLNNYELDLFIGNIKQLNAADVE